MQAVVDRAYCVKHPLRIARLFGVDVAATPKAKFVPRLADPQVRGTLRALRRVERDVQGMTLDQALKASRALEASEVNVIFVRLLKQVGKAQTELFAEALEGASHPEPVPRRIAALRDQLGSEAPVFGLAPGVGFPQ